MWYNDRLSLLWLHSEGNWAPPCPEYPHMFGIAMWIRRGAEWGWGWAVASESTHYKSGHFVCKRNWIWNQESNSVANTDEKTASKLSTNIMESDQDHSILKLWSIYTCIEARAVPDLLRFATLWHFVPAQHPHQRGGGQWCGGWGRCHLKWIFHYVVSNSSNSTGFLWSSNTSTSKEFHSRRWIENVSYKASWSFACLKLVFFFSLLLHSLNQYFNCLMHTVWSGCIEHVRRFPIACLGLKYQICSWYEMTGIEAAVIFGTFPWLVWLNGLVWCEGSQKTSLRSNGWMKFNDLNDLPEPKVNLVVMQLFLDWSHGFSHKNEDPRCDFLVLWGQVRKRKCQTWPRSGRAGVNLWESF